MNSTIKIALIARNTAGKILLVKEYSNKKSGYFWNLIKWTVEYSDIDLFETVKRECREESGMLCENLRITWLYQRNRDEEIGLLIGFEGDLIDGVMSQSNNISWEEVIEVRLFSINEIEHLSEEDFIDARTFYYLQRSLAWIAWVDFQSF